MNSTAEPFTSPTREFAWERSVERPAVCWPRLAGAIVVAAVAFGLWVVRWNGPIDLRYDAGVYYLLGTSLATGHGYRITSEPGAPTDVQYPPGLPAIVATHALVLGSTDPQVVAPALRHTYAILFLVMALATLAFALRWLDSFWATVATVLCLLHTGTFLLSDMLFTELPFTTVAVLLALLLSRVGRRPTTKGREIIGFLLVSAGFLLRTAGIALSMAWVVDALARKRPGLAVIRGGLALLPIVAWEGFVLRTQATEDYRQPAYAYQRASYQFYNVTYGENMALKDPFRPEEGRADAPALVARAEANVGVLPLALGEAVSEPLGFWRVVIGKIFRRLAGPDGSWPDTIMVLPLVSLASLAVVGLITQARARAWFIVGFVAISVALICSTPWPGQVGRYLAPIRPFLAVAVALGFVRLFETAGRLDSAILRLMERTALVAIGLATMIVQGYAVQNAFAVRNYSPVTSGSARTIDAPRWFYHDQTWADWNHAVDWIQENAPPGAIVATTVPHLLFLRAHRRAVMPPMEAETARENRLMDSVPVSYVIIDELEFLDVSRHYALPAVEAAPDRWQLRRTFNQTRIYERVARR